MDIQKEREAFEELIDIEIIISEGFKFNPNINQYYHPDHTNHRLSYAYLMGAWMVWQEKAQAVPEGFVLVEKTKLMQIVGSAAIIEPITRGNPLMSKYKTELDFILSTVRAVIETQEPVND